VDEGGVNTGTAYLLWLFFGFLGIHRFYLKQHNATSWAIWFFTGQFFIIGWLLDGIFFSKQCHQIQQQDSSQAL
jgi:TM2 domain-containing membrane protein YozV